LQLATATRPQLATCNEEGALRPPKTSGFALSDDWHHACADERAENCFRSEPMADVMFVVVTVGFFIVVWVYAKGLDHL
jgi:hypothetical protein